jgi:hypothetical protein
MPGLRDWEIAHLMELIATEVRLGIGLYIDMTEEGSYNKQAAITSILKRYQ